MTSSEFKQARLTLGLNKIEFARALGFGPNGRNQVRLIEQGANITGPLSLAVKHLLATLPHNPIIKGDEQ